MRATLRWPVRRAVALLLMSLTGVGHAQTIYKCKAPDGFSMSIKTDRGRYTVCLDEWRDEFALAGEAVELIESALRGDIRIRVDISTVGRRHTAERRLPNGGWINLPSFEDTIDGTSTGKLIRTVYLRNGPVLT